MLTSLLHGLLSVRGWPAYAIPAALCFGEAAIFLGFVIPGEIAVVYGGVLASQHHVSLPLMLVTVVVAAILGDTTGFLVGRHFGPWLLERRPLRGNSGVDRTRDFLNRKGGPAVFLGRFVSLFRALVPGMAGASDLSYPTFFVFNALGGIVWGVGYVLVGYLAGNSYQKALRVVGTTSTGILIGVVAIVAALLAIRHFRRKRQEQPAPTKSKAD
ncbi:MAG: DedA family protein [Acidimicrobiales bacterium]